MMCDPACSHWRILQHNKIGAFRRRRRQRSPESSQHLAIWATKTSFESNMGTPMAQHIVKTKWKSSPQGPTWVQYEICWDILELDDLATAENTALGQTFFLQRLARCGLLCRFPGPCCFKHLLTAELSSLGCCLKYEGSWDLFGMCFLINVLDQTTKTMQDMYFIIMVIFSGRKQHCTRMILYVHFRVP